MPFGNNKTKKQQNKKTKNKIKKIIEKNK